MPLVLPLLPMQLHGIPTVPAEILIIGWTSSRGGVDQRATTTPIGP
jgi:hypothetical protein